MKSFEFEISPEGVDSQKVSVEAKTLAEAVEQVFSAHPVNFKQIRWV